MRQNGGAETVGGRSEAVLSTEKFDRGNVACRALQHLGVVRLPPSRGVVRRPKADRCGLAGARGCSRKSDDDGMSPPRRRSRLRQEEGGEKERVRGEFHDPDLAVGSGPAHDESGPLE
jgi:hypothetical protein